MISLPSPVTNEPSRTNPVRCPVLRAQAVLLPARGPRRPCRQRWPRATARSRPAASPPPPRAHWLSNLVSHAPSGWRCRYKAAAGPGPVRSAARMNHMMTRPRTLFCCLWFVQLRSCTRENVSQKKESFLPPQNSKYIGPDLRHCKQARIRSILYPISHQLSLKRTTFRANNSTRLQTT